MSKNWRKRVLVTRPEPGASGTVLRLEELGFLPIRLPLQETRAVAVGEQPEAGDIAAVAVPSSSAIRHAPAPLLERWSALPCFAVGAATAKAAEKAGFSDVIVGQGDAASLAEMILASGVDGRVAYLCGKVRRSVLEDRLGAAGIPVSVVETYDTLPLAYETETVSRALSDQPIDYVLVFSANAAALVQELIAGPPMAHLFENAGFICISARVADVFSGKGHKIVVAAEPSEAALLEALQESSRAAS